MKVLIYRNKAKDSSGEWLNSCINLLKNEEVLYEIIDDCDLKLKDTADAMLVLGGDGTILNLTEFASKNQIPIIGINAGKLGFLTEFEQFEMPEAISLLKHNKLIQDKRSNVCCEVNGKRFFALNDLVIQRIRLEDRGNNISALSVEIDGIQVEKIFGDGAIVSTPTGSTAYSLSAGGPILAPGINVFSITPIAAHSFNQRAIVYSSKSVCNITISNECATGLFVDGIFGIELKKGDTLKIYSPDYQTIFLRKDTFNFYERLSKKLKDRTAVINYD